VADDKHVNVDTGGGDDTVQEHPSSQESNVNQPKSGGGSTNIDLSVTKSDSPVEKARAINSEIPSSLLSAESGWKDKDDSGLSTDQSLHNSSPLQDGHNQLGLSISGTIRSNDKDRYQRSLSSCANSISSTQIPSIPVQKSQLLLSNSSSGIKHQSVDIHNDNAGMHNKTVGPNSNKDSIIHRRPVNYGLTQQQFNKRTNQSTTTSRMVHQHDKIHTPTNMPSYIPGPTSRYSASNTNHPTPISDGAFRSFREATFPKANETKGISQSGGKSKLPNTSLSRPPSIETPTGISNGSTIMDSKSTSKVGSSNSQVNNNTQRTNKRTYQMSIDSNSNDNNGLKSHGLGINDNRLAITDMGDSINSFRTTPHKRARVQSSKPFSQQFIYWIPKQFYRHHFRQNG